MIKIYVDSPSSEEQKSVIIKKILDIVLRPGSSC